MHLLCRSLLNSDILNLCTWIFHVGAIPPSPSKRRLKAECRDTAGYALNLFWMQAILKGAIRALSRPTAKKEA